MVDGWATDSEMGVSAGADVVVVMIGRIAGVGSGTVLTVEDGACALDGIGDASVVSATATTASIDGGGVGALRDGVAVAVGW